MMLFRLFSTENEVAPQILTGERIYLRPPVRADQNDWIALRTQNRAFHAPVSPLSALKDLNAGGYQRRLKFYVEDWKRDKSYTFFIFLKSSDRLIGSITLNNIVRGAGMMCTLGYWLDEAHTRKGYMTDAVNLVCSFAFTALSMHRVQAGCIVDNPASAGVLLKCGFVEEGLARQYIKIAGAWKDHRIFARLSDQG